MGVDLPNILRSTLTIFIALSGSWALAKSSGDTAIPLQSLGPGFASASDRAFRELIRTNTLAHAYYLRAERNRMVTRSDLRFLRLFEQSEMLAPLLLVIRFTQEERVTRFRDGLTANARRVYSDSQEFKQLHQIMADLGLDMGLHPEDVDNVLLFIISGDANAFAASGSFSKPIFGITQGLLDLLNKSKSSRGEKRAVMAHEYGHVIAEHMHVQHLHKLMMGLLTELFTESGSVFQATGTPEGELRQAMLSVRALAQANPQAAAKLLLEYTRLATETMDEYLAPADAIHYFRKDIIPKLEDIVKGGRSTIALLHPEQFKHYSEILNASIDRSNERSADQIASMSARNHLLATAILRLNGSEQNAMAKAEEIEEKLEGSRRQADEMRLWTRERLAEQNKGTHPPNNIRTDLIIKASPYPAVLFANPFTKILLVYNYLCAETIALADFINHMVANHAKDEQSAHSLQTEQERLKAHLAAKEQTEKVIFDLVSAIDSGAKGHPRIRNLLEFALAEKELSLDKIAVLENQIAGARLSGRREDVAVMQKRVNVIRKFELSALDPLFDIAEKALKASATAQPGAESSAESESRQQILQTRLLRLAMARTVTSPSAARAQRLSLFNGGETTRASRLPGDLVKSVNQSNYFVPNPNAGKDAAQPEAAHLRPASFLPPPLCDRILQGL